MAAGLRRLLEGLYLHYDHRFVDPDPLQFVRAHEGAEDREVVGLIASSLAYGNVLQIKRSVARVLALLGSRPARALRRLDPRKAASSLEGFRHRFSTGRDVACLLHFLRQMLASEGSVEAFFLRGHANGAAHVGPALASFSARALALDHADLYGRGELPGKAGVRFFLPSPEDGSACKRLNLFLRWMVRKDDVDLGVWSRAKPSALVVPVDAHIDAIARRVGLTRYRSPGWPMALDITAQLRKFDASDPVKYDFALHRLGLLGKEDEIASLSAAVQPRGRREPRRRRAGARCR